MAKKKVAVRGQGVAKELQVDSMAPEAMAQSGNLRGEASMMAGMNNSKRNSYPHLGNMPGPGSGKF